MSSIWWMLICYGIWALLWCLSQCLLFQFSHVAPKSGNQPQEHLAKFGYTTIFFKKNLGILLHVGKPLEPIKLKMTISKEES